MLKQTLAHRAVLALACALSVPGWAAAQATDEILYYHADAIGSVRMVTDASGQVVERYDYLPFGEAWPNEVESPNPRRFAGKEKDQETGLDYFGARHLMTRAGRFATVDPVIGPETALSDPQRWNRYAYVGNRPTQLVDPDGRNWISVLHRLASHPMVQRAQTATASQGTRAWNALTRLFNTAQGKDLVQTAAEIGTGSELGPMGGAGIPLGRGSTGRTIAADLPEHLAKQQAISDPEAGIVLTRVVKSDSRWLASEGWVKMSQFINGIEIHYVRNTLTGEIDDFKFVRDHLK